MSTSKRKEAIFGRKVSKGKSKKEIALNDERELANAERKVANGKMIKL
jgi:hypothetical protein